MKMHTKDLRGSVWFTMAVAIEHCFPLPSPLCTWRHNTSFLWENSLYMLPIIQNRLGARHMCVFVCVLYIDDVTTQIRSSPYYSSHV